MEYRGVLCVMSAFVALCSCQGFADLPMLPQSSSERTFLYLVPPVGEPRLNKDTACTVINTQERRTSLLISIQDFDCVRECNWKIKVYISGCLQREFCCEVNYNRTTTNHNFVVEASDFTTNDVVYIVHNNIHSDANGSRLKILVHGYFPFSPTTTPGPIVDPQMTTTCGVDPWTLLYRDKQECPPPPPPTTTTTTTTAPTTTAQINTTIVYSTRSVTLPTTTTESQTTTQADPNQHFFSIDTYSNKSAVIGGATAAVVLVLINAVVCVVCFSRKGKIIICQKVQMTSSDKTAATNHTAHAGNSGIPPNSTNQTTDPGPIYYEITDVAPDHETDEARNETGLTRPREYENWTASANAHYERPTLILAQPQSLPYSSLV